MTKIHSLHDLCEEEVLRKVIADGEGVTLEFKSNLISVANLAKLMSSFANTEGGLILIGIDDGGNAIGIKNTDKFNELVLKSTVITKPGIRGYSSGIEYLDGKPIGCILIWPEQGLPVSINGKYFKRLGLATLEYSQTEFKQIIEEKDELQSLVIASSAIEEFLNLADEDTLVKVLLVPILREFNFKCVSYKGHIDRSLEYGQDIRGFKFQLPTGHWLYFAAQVKTGRISYSAKKPSMNIEGILNQVRMAFKKEMFDFETNSHHLPDHIFLIASGKIVEGAREYLCKQLSSVQQRILFWDSNLIIEKCEEKGLSHCTQLEIKKYLDAIKK